MDKETLLRLAQPAATFALALSVATLPMTVRAYGEAQIVKGFGTNGAVKIECISGC